MIYCTHAPVPGYLDLHAFLSCRLEHQPLLGNWYFISESRPSRLRLLCYILVSPIEAVLVRCPINRNEARSPIARLRTRTHFSCFSSQSEEIKKTIQRLSVIGMYDDDDYDDDSRIEACSEEESFAIVTIHNFNRMQGNSLAGEMATKAKSRRRWAHACRSAAHNELNREASLSRGV